VCTHVGRHRVWLFKEFKCLNFVDSYFYFPGEKAPALRPAADVCWKEEGEAAPVPDKIPVLGTGNFSCKEATFLQKSHVPHVSLTRSDTASIPIDVTFLWGFFGVCHSKCKYWMLPSTWVSLSVISHEQKKILFYSILFYSILAARFMCWHSFRWKLTQNVAGLTLLCSYNFRFTGTFLLKRKKKTEVG